MQDRQVIPGLSSTGETTYEVKARQAGESTIEGRGGEGDGRGGGGG